MPLQNFIDKSLPAVSAAWLNMVDALKFTIFGDATTKAQARANLTTDLPFEITNGGTGSRTGISQVLSGIDTGAVNAYVVGLTPNPALVAGAFVRFTPLSTNTGPSTINGAAVIRANGVALTGGELSSAGPTVLQYTGAQWQIVSTAGAQPGFERTAAEVAAGYIPSNYTISPSPIAGLARYGGDPTGVADSQPAFNTASLVGQAFTVAPGTYLINSNLTIVPGYQPQAGAMLRPANGVTVSLTAALVNPPDTQLFDLSLGGLVILGGQNGIVRATWWGLQGLPSAKVNNEVPLNQAWMALMLTPTGTGVAGGTIVIPRGDYYKSGSSYHSGNIGYVGEGNLYPLILANAGTWPIASDNGSNLFRSQRADPVLFTVPPNAGATTGTITAGYLGATNTAPAVAANLAIVFFQRNGAACEIHRIPSIHNGDTTITWTGGLAANCAFYAAILDEQAIFGNRIEHLRLNGGNVSGANLPRLIYAPAWQQQSGPFDLFLENFNQDGILIDQGYGGAALIKMRQLQITPNGNNSGFGIHINLPNYNGTGYYQVDMHEVSITNATANMPLAFPIAMPLTFTAAPAATATSATLNANWLGTTGSYLVFFVETAGGANELRTVTLTNGQTTATWVGGLGANCNAATAASNNAGAVTGVLASAWPNSSGVWQIIFQEDGTGGGSAGFPRTRMVTLTNGATTATWQGDLPRTTTLTPFGVTPLSYGIGAVGNVLLNCDDVHAESIYGQFQLGGGASVTGNAISVGGNANVAALFTCNTGWTGYIKASGVTPGGALVLISPDSAHFYAQSNFLPPDGELVWPPVFTRPIAAAYVTGAGVPVLTNSYNMASVIHQVAGQQRLVLATPAAWSSSTIYYPGQAVQNGGSGYICKASNINQAPPNGTYWTAASEGVNVYGVLCSSGDTAQPYIVYSKVNSYAFDIFTRNLAGSLSDAAEFTVEVYHRT